VGKRQVRILRNDILRKRIEIQGKQGHVILADHVVHNGQILDVTENHLLLRDPRFNQHRLELAAIQEVIYDKETDY